MARPPSSATGSEPLHSAGPPAAELASICSQADALRAELSALLRLGNPAKNEELLTIFLRAGRELEELLARLNAVGRAFAQEAAKISRGLEELAQKKELLQAQAGEMRAKVSAAQEGYEAKVRALEEQIEALQSQRRILETNSRIQASRLEQAEEELDKSRTDHRLAEKKCLAFQERALEIEENRAALSRQNASLQGALEELRRIGERGQVAGGSPLDPSSRAAGERGRGAAPGARDPREARLEIDAALYGAIRILEEALARLSDSKDMPSAESKNRLFELLQSLRDLRRRLDP